MSIPLAEPVVTWTLVVSMLNTPGVRGQFIFATYPTREACWTAGLHVVPHSNLYLCLPLDEVRERWPELVR